MTVIRRATAAEIRKYATSRPVMLLALDEAAEKLADSSFMRPWILYAIKNALETGAIFHLEKDGVPMATYQMATEAEIQKLATEGVKQLSWKKTFSTPPPVAKEPKPKPPKEPKPKPLPKPKAPKAVREFVFTWKGLDKKLPAMPPQASKLLQIVAGAGKPARLNTDALGALLEAGRAKAGIAADIPLMGRWNRFYYGGMFAGLMTRTGG